MADDALQEWIDREERRYYVGRHENSWYSRDMTAANVLDQLHTATEAMEEVAALDEGTKGPRGEGVVPRSALRWLKVAYPILDHVRRLLPHVECWTVGRPSFDTRTVIWGCQYKLQAKRLCAKANEVRAHRSTEWTVEYGPCQLSNVVKASYTAEDLAATEESHR